MCILFWAAVYVFGMHRQCISLIVKHSLMLLIHSCLCLSFLGLHTHKHQKNELIDCRAQFPPFKSHKMREAVDMKWTHAKHRAMRTICAWSCAPCMPQARKGQSPKCYWEAYTYCCYYCYYSDWQVRYYNEKFYIPVIYLMMKMMLVCSMAIKTWICM